MFDFKKHTEFDPREQLPDSPNNHIMANIPFQAKMSNNVVIAKDAVGVKPFHQSCDLATHNSASTQPSATNFSKYENITVLQQHMVNHLPPPIHNMVQNMSSIGPLNNVSTKSFNRTEMDTRMCIETVGKMKDIMHIKSNNDNQLNTVEKLFHPRGLERIVEKYLVPNIALSALQLSLMFFLVSLHKNI